MATAVDRKAGVVKVAGHPAVAVVKAMAADGRVERATRPAEGAAMHPLAAAKNKSDAGWVGNPAWRDNRKRL